MDTSKNSTPSFKELMDRAANNPSMEQLKWKTVFGFYNDILTIMAEDNISRKDLAIKLNKSKSAISQMLNETPNISLGRIVELTYALDLEMQINVSRKRENKFNLYECRLSDMTTLKISDLNLELANFTNSSECKVILENKKSLIKFGEAA